MKRFGATEALRGVDLAVERATVLGVLGPNGAGKTTAVRILTTLLQPDAGRAFIDGIDVVADPRRGPGPHRPHRPVRRGRRAAHRASRTSSTSVGCSTAASRRPRPAAGELLERFDLADAADRVVKHATRAACAVGSTSR